MGDERNRAEAGIFDTEAKLDEFADQISSEKRDELNEKLNALRDDLTNDSVSGAELREKWQDLQKEVMSVFSEAYSNKAAENSDGSEQSSSDSGNESSESDKKKD